MMKEDAVTGFTSNPTIFQKALSSGTAYDEDMRKLLGETDDPTEIFFSLALQDIRDACDVLKPAYEASNGLDGYVSMEVEPGIAYDTERTFDQARWIATEVERPNLFVKIPATVAGLPAIEDCTAHGTSINITLIFGLDRYKAVVEAYLRGLERFVAGGGDPSSVASVASFFVSRVDTETDRRLPEGSPLRGKAAVANAKLANALFRARVSRTRWEALAAKGARLQRPLWASTSTKNPAYPSTLYVDELIGPDTVNTLAPASIEALHNGEGDQHADTVTENVEEALRVIRDLADAGVDFDDVTDTLEREGV